MAKGPVLIELDGSSAAQADVNTAPQLPDPVTPLGEGQAMQTAAKFMARKPSFLGRLFWSAALALVGAVVSIAAWDFVNGVIARWPILGMVISHLHTITVINQTPNRWHRDAALIIQP